MKDKIIKIIKSPNIEFIITKFITYGITFIVGILLAKYLGVFYFGIYGFFKLLSQYLSYSNIGVNYSVLVLASQQQSQDDNLNRKYLSSAILITSITALFFLFIFLVINNYEIFHLNEKYLLGSYIFYLFGLLLLKQISVILINICRVYNKLRIINVAYIFPVICELVIIPFANAEHLFILLLITMLVSQAIVVTFLFIKLPFKFFLSFDFNISKILIKKGFFLLFYNISFYLIMLIIRSIISSNYSVEEFSLYTFAYNISESIFLLNNAIGFLLYPLMLKKLSILNGEQALEYMNKIKQIYMTIANLIILLAIIILPIFQIIVPEYLATFQIIFILLFVQMLIANTFVNSTFLIQRGLEKRITFDGIVSILVLLIFIYFTFFITRNLFWISCSLIIAFLYYNIVLSYRVYKLIDKVPVQRAIINSITSDYCYLLPLLTGIMLVYFNIPYWIILISMTTVVYLFNFKNIQQTVFFCKFLLFKTNDDK